MMNALPLNAVIAGTGHRPDKIGANEAYVRSVIRERLAHYKPTAIITGMAVGFDQWWATEALLAGVRVVAAVPFIGQESRWPTNAQRAYNAILRHCRVVMLQHKRPQDHRQAAEWLQARNAWMVDNADGVLACYNGDPTGGTVNCIRYAKTRKKPIDIFDPYGG